MVSTSFGAPFSLWERALRRCSGALALYWRVARWLYSFLVIGILVTAIVQWIIDSVGKTGRLPDPLRWPPLRVLEHLPAPIAVLVVLGLAVIAGSVAVAYLADRDQAYYALLGASTVSYRVMRRSTPGVAAGPELLDGFDDELYAERADALATYNDFLRQHDKRILLIVGPGGSGKSTFLMRRMGELSGVLGTRTPFRPHPCVLINCEADTLVDTEKLLERIREKLGKDLKDIFSDDVRGRHDRALVIFIDAINENRTARSADINKLLTDFAQGYLDALHGFEVYLCISVRKAYWDEQRRQFADDPTSAKLGWLNHVYLPERPITSAVRSGRSTETASISLADFAESEFDAACQNYLNAFEIDGQIEDKRTRTICRNPLMLEFFCRTFKGRGIGVPTVRDLARDIDLFNEYAKTGLARIADKVGIRSIEPVINGETLAQRAIRGLLLELALEMQRQGRTFLTDDEVFAVARAHASESLEYPRRGVRTVDGLYQDGSVLHALLSEAVVLERGRTILSGRDEVSGVRFRYERYLEYSIGRGLVRSWRNGHMSRAEIESEFSRLMRRHIELRAQGFHNLREGLGMAILVAEQEPALPAGTHIELLRILARDADFDWNQLACRMVQELRPFNRPMPSAGSWSPEQKLEVDALLAVLDELAKKNDFVLRWDIERALIHVVHAGKGHVVVEHLRRWLDPTATFAQRLFAGESFGYLFRQLPEQRQELAGILRQIIETGSEPDFWILRSLMFSIGAMIDTLDADTEHDSKFDQLKAEVEILPDELIQLGQRWWDRSVVLATQVERAAVRGGLGRWQAWPWTGESPWTLVNVALATEQACVRRGGTGEIIGLLRQLWLARPAYDPHLSWAIWHVLGQVVGSAVTAEPERADASELRAEIEADARQQQAADPRAEWVLPARPRAGQPIPAVTGGTVALVYHPEYGHTDLHNHPESKERVQSILEFLEAVAGADGRFLRDLVTYVSPGQLGDGTDVESEGLLELVHTPEWIRRVRALSQQLAEEAKPDIVLESDVEVRAGSYEGAVLAMRGAVRAMDLASAVPGVPLAVALVRPPGHLAGNKICIFNNVAIAARHGQQVQKAKTGKVPRVLIVDIDAHHGKSTQDIFYADDSVFYFSIHQEGVHPGTGRFAERGSGPGVLRTVNVPIPARSGDRVYTEVFRLVLQPILDGFQPELILVSMGLDAYCQDNFSQLNLTERGFSELAAMLLQYRQQHPGPGIVASLEGGYELHGMGRCVGEFIGTFIGWAPAPAPGPSLRPGTPTSWFDDYLLDTDRGLAPAVPREHQEWHENFTKLATTLRTQ